MNKSIIYALTILYIVCGVSAYMGFTQSNLTVSLNSSNNSIILNSPDCQIDSFLFNDTNTSRVYSWLVPFEYNLSNLSVSIITYNLTYENVCDYTDVLNAIQDRVNNINCTYQAKGEEYYKLYLDCFTNLTVCDAYMNANQEYRSLYDNCSLDKNGLIQAKQSAEVGLQSCNSNMNACSLERENFKGQRFVYAIIVGVIALGIGVFLTKIWPQMKRTGKIRTHKEIESSIDHINPDFVKMPIQQNLAPRYKENTPINPDSIRPRGGI